MWNFYFFLSKENLVNFLFSKYNLKKCQQPQNLKQVQFFYKKNPTQKRNEKKTVCPNESTI